MDLHVRFAVYPFSFREVCEIKGLAGVQITEESFPQFGKADTLWKTLFFSLFMPFLCRRIFKFFQLLSNFLRLDTFIRVELLRL